jgi:serine/threonine protein kinase
MSNKTQIREPIPGYVVKQRIGVGGYGEVWSAQAPGGLSKAIKFVYGYFDDARATRELKALDRIKQVRHPFLLSLERFEIVDGQLVIVTELADMSLKDRFEQVRQEGSEGIPREELLRYLRDAADALDYMNESFSLQHLDVKPENLLLVGGHVKVADFGLVKDLQHDATASLMGGLTPIYAAPEVFDDRPSMRSDQYSLAIVYQEMLTGHLPFPGRTPAQLASQHLHATPKFTGLNAPDQAVIARALAKEPTARFPNCRAMVDALYGQPPSATRPDAAARKANVDTTPISAANSKTAPNAGRELQPPGSQTIMRGDERKSTPLSESRCAAALAHKSLIEPIAELGPLDFTDVSAELRPTLFLGVGGTAGRVLRRLRRRLADRFGPSAMIPAMPMLFLDTDARFLYQMTEGDHTTALADRETLSLPLRGAHDYTTDSRNILSWLSRRWLYNIPRSLQTEGRRPLGRLALVDHAPQVLDKLRSALTAMTSPESIAASKATVGGEFDAKRPRVFIVASLSGGTGGGMAIDLAYGMRRLLADLGCPDDGVCAVLTHSTDRNTSAGELATANAYACLKELQHYREAGYQPGPGGLPAPETGGDLPNVYFVPLGTELGDSEYNEATEKLAAYLYLSAATPVAAILDHCRKSTSAQAAEVSVRGFATASIGSLQTSLPEVAADFLCQSVLDFWRGAHQQRRPRGAPRSLFPTATDLVTGEQHAASLGLDLTMLRAGVGALLDKELGTDAESIFARLQAKLDPHLSSAERILALGHTMRELVEPPPVGKDGLKIPLPAAHVSIERGLKQLATPLGDKIREWILHHVDDPVARVGWAVVCRDWYAAFLKGLDGEATEIVHDTQQNISALEHRLGAVAKQPAKRTMFGMRRAEQKYSAEIDAMLLLLLRLRLQEFTLRSVIKILRILMASVTAAGDQLKDFQRELGQSAATFDADLFWDDDEAPPAESILDEVEDSLARQLRSKLPELARIVDERIEKQYLAPHGGLRHVCQKADALRVGLLAALKAETRAEILGGLRGIALSEAVLGEGTDDEAKSSRLMACQALARPMTLDCGGSQRMLALIPSGEGCQPLVDALRSRLSPQPTITLSEEIDLMLCYEQQELSLPHVAERLIAGRNDYPEIAARLHTRVDINWSELPSPTSCAKAKANEEQKPEACTANTPSEYDGPANVVASVLSMTQPTPQPAN